MSRNPNQGSLLLPPGAFGHETVAPPEHSFPKQIESSAAQDPNGRIPLMSDVISRNILVRRALGNLGTMAEKVPATRVKDDPDAKAALEIRHRGNYKSEVAKMQAAHKIQEKLFDSNFADIWGLEETQASGLTPGEELQAQFEKDKADFIAKFSESARPGGISLSRAKLNRSNYRAKLDRKEIAYKKRNLGEWPVRKARTGKSRPINHHRAAA